VRREWEPEELIASWTLLGSSQGELKRGNGTILKLCEGYDPDTAETCRQTHTGWSTVCGQEIIALAL
jgi:hypothetical protein